MVSRSQFIAVNRFGMGAGRQDINALPANPEDWISRQTENKQAEPLQDYRHKSTEFVKLFFRLRQEKNQAAIMKFRNDSRLYYRQAVHSHLKQAVLSPNPFLERLTAFWLNHFTVSAQAKSVLYGLAGTYENEAIRPHILGKFEDMLLAVVQHPAMLIYLDNIRSIGPDSRGGQLRGRGVNENLAREILELHTLGVDGGYRQDDVIALAKIITGWSLSERDGGFQFRRFLHEPGRKTLLGKQYGPGYESGVQALKDLARHPSTARFLVTKLARHFIQDAPQESDIRILSEKYMDSGGDLKAVYATLASLPSVWQNQTPKVKTPYDFVISTARVLGMNETILNSQTLNRLFQTLVLMRQQPFGAPSPAGWPDTQEAWVSPDIIMNRLEWCHAVTRVMPANRTQLDWILETIESASDPETLAWIKRAPGVQDGIALALASPAHQRR